MAFMWTDYLDLAKSLRGDKIVCNREASLRGGVSRAYYAAFCHARKYAEGNLGFAATHRNEDHGLLREHLSKCGRKGIAADLDSLRQWRNCCDYNDELSPNHNVRRMLDHAIRRAESIIGQL